MSETTISVRIALAIDGSGDWSAVGGSNYTEREAIDECVGNIHDGLPGSAFFVECSVPLPEATTIAGAVMEAERIKFLESQKRVLERCAESLEEMRKAALGQ